MNNTLRYVIKLPRIASANDCATFQNFMEGVPGLAVKSKNNDRKTWGVEFPGPLPESLLQEVARLSGTIKTDVQYDLE